MTPEQELLLEQVTSAHRERGFDGAIRQHPAWFDLDDEGRVAAYEATLALRKLEQAADPGSQSSTAKSILRRLTRP